ncbi:hypothetical protein [Phytohabitans rumicis]|nr:hypothetical protein [Phytohabitans rumicis]
MRRIVDLPPQAVDAALAGLAVAVMVTVRITASPPLGRGCRPRSRWPW